MKANLCKMTVKCPAAIELWRSIGLEELIEHATNEDREGSAVLESLLHQQGNQQYMNNINLKELISVTSWYLWWIRRRRTHGEVVPPLFKCKMAILSIVANHVKVTQPVGISSDQKWSRPDTRQVKINVDASFHVDSHSGAVGSIIRDYQGQFVAASCKFLPHIMTATMAEAVAMKEGLRLAENLGYHNVIAEGDCLEIIEACTGQETWWTESAAIFADCLDTVTSIGRVTFHHCRREANKAAHEIARVCFIDKMSCIWDDEPPSFLLESLVNDVTIH